MARKERIAPRMVTCSSQLLRKTCEVRQFLVTRRANTAPSRVPRRQAASRVRPSVPRVLHSMTGTAAFVRNGRLDILAINQLGRALYAVARG